MAVLSRHLRDEVELLVWAAVSVMSRLLGTKVSILACPFVRYQRPYCFQVISLVGKPPLDQEACLLAV